LPDPLLLLSRDRRVLAANQAARQLFGETLTGRDLALSLRHPACLDAVASVLAGDAGNRQVEMFLPVPVARDFSARVRALPLPGEDVAADPDLPVAILALQDLTAVRRAEQLRADFVANASHELRTPLATLLGFIETLQGPAREDAAARERFLAIMHEQAQRMARLIRDLLSLSRIEMNEHTPPSGSVELAAIVGPVADMLKLQLEAKKMRIEIEADADLPPVAGDSDELTQVFQNLIDNAVKYGRAGTAVSVEMRRHGAGERQGVVAVRVRDQGEGIPRAHLPRLTERFYRVDSARSRQLGGTGLGLAIVKHIVNRHRGSLTIESVEGEGSCFTVYLPAAAGRREWAGGLHQTVT
ncbi:MAG: GHKL domain-containing protein, partial [Alphaproteobacteria bacterium]|nr:GHKL domain-containing protein [Alphaproteobacteria bacterium]